MKNPGTNNLNALLFFVEGTKASSRLSLCLFFIMRLWTLCVCVFVCLCGQRTRKLRKGWVSDCWMKFDICPDYKMILRTCLIPRRQHYTSFISSRPANTDGWLAGGSLEIRPSHAHVLTAHTRICLLFLLETLTGIKWHFKFSHVAFIQPTSSLR